MSTLEQIDAAVEILGTDKLVILHATSTYPLPAGGGQPAHDRHPARALRRPGRLLGPRARPADLARRGRAGRRRRRAAHHARPHDVGLRPGRRRSSRAGLEHLVRDIRIIEEALGDGVKRVMPGELAPDVPPASRGRLTMRRAACPRWPSSSRPCSCSGRSRRTRPAWRGHTEIRVRSGVPALDAAARHARRRGASRGCHPAPGGARPTTRRRPDGVRGWSVTRSPGSGRPPSCGAGPRGRVVLLDDGLATVTLARALVAGAPAVRASRRSSGVVGAAARSSSGTWSRASCAGSPGEGRVTMFTAMPLDVPLMTHLHGIGVDVVTHRFDWLATQQPPIAPAEPTVVVGSGLVADGWVRADPYVHVGRAASPSSARSPTCPTGAATPRSSRGSPRCRACGSTRPACRSRCACAGCAPPQRVVCLPSTAYVLLDALHASTGVRVQVRPGARRLVDRQRRAGRARAPVERARAAARSGPQPRTRCPDRPHRLPLTGDHHRSVVRPRALLPVPDGPAARRHDPHRAVQLGLRPAHRRHVRLPHRGHRRRARLRGELPPAARRAALARARLGRGRRGRRPARAVPAVAALRPVRRRRRAGSSRPATRTSRTRRPRRSRRGTARPAATPSSATTASTATSPTSRSWPSARRAASPCCACGCPTRTSRSPTSCAAT